MTVWSKEVLAENLRSYMESRGINQKELAEIVGVSAPTINDWLKAKKYPRIDKIEIMADYFGILKSHLIEDKTKIEKNNDIIANIVARLRYDEDFLSVVQELNRLDKKQLCSVKQMLSAFLK